MQNNNTPNQLLISNWFTIITYILVQNVNILYQYVSIVDKSIGNQELIWHVKFSLCATDKMTT